MCVCLCVCVHVDTHRLSIRAQVLLLNKRGACNNKIL